MKNETKKTIFNKKIISHRWKIQMMNFERTQNLHSPICYSKEWRPHCQISCSGIQRHTTESFSTLWSLLTADNDNNFPCLLLLSWQHVLTFLMLKNIKPHVHEKHITYYTLSEVTTRLPDSYPRVPNFQLSSSA